MISTDQFQSAIDLIRRSRRILLSTHARPDGDAMGSIFALQSSIDAQAANDGRPCQTQMMVLHEIGDTYRGLLTDGAWITEDNYPEDRISAGELDAFDLIIIADTRAVRQLPVLGEYLLCRRQQADQTGRNTLVIDHHLTGDDIATCQLIDSTAGAAGEIVYDLIKTAGWPISPAAAEALFVAVSTDSGWFRFENTSADTLQKAAELVRHGARPGKIYQEMFQNHPYQKIKLLGRTLDTLELHDEGRLAVMHITQAMLEACGATRPMIENIVNEPMQIDTVIVSLLLVELPENKVRCSLRSKHTLDCADITGRLGGGGHARAAGLTLACNWQEARRTLIEAISAALN